MEEFKRILIPTDGSDNTKYAVKKGVSLAKLLGVDVVAIYVLNKTPFFGMPADSMMTNIYNMLEEEGKRAIDYVDKEGKREGVKVEGRLLEGIPSEEIVKASNPTDIIVMSTLGRTGLDKILLGNVVERVVRHAKCPVMVVRTNSGE